MPVPVDVISSGARDSAMRRLRARTALGHAQLEERMSGFEWLRTREAYAQVLEQLYGFHVRVEPALIAGGADTIAGLEVESRSKVPLLSRDLLALGYTARDLEALPRVETLPRYDTPSRVLGAMYVVEGATLGGKLIAREVERRLGLHSSTGTAFFGAYGRDVGRRWRRFGEVLERESELLDVDAICDAAGATFAALDRWLVL